MSWVIAGLMLFPMLAFVASVLAWKRFDERDERRSPINTKLHFTPGEQLRRRMEDLNDRMIGVMMVVLMVGPTMTTAWLSARLKDVHPGMLQLTGIDWVMLFVVLSAGFICAYEMIQIGYKRRAAREGLRGELAVGQYLAPLMGKGCLVFNDVPADGFNLDHVVIGPSAVFAVETKSRKKPKETGKEAVTVGYDGIALRFPTHIETTPLEQSKAQARWLAAMLFGAAGEPVRVVPVVALPGWWIENTHRGVRPEVWVTTGKNANFMVGEGFGPPLSESLRNRIAHAISQRYPDPD